MKKQFLSLFLCITMLLSLIPETGAAAELTDGNFRYIVSDGGAVVLGCIEQTEELVIPGMLGGYPVTQIINLAFSRNNVVKTVEFEEGVKTISYQAFSRCENLESVVLPDSVTALGHRIFEGTKITSVNLPKGVTWVAGAYNGSPFAGAEYLTEIVVEDGLETVLNGMFAMLTNVTEITLPDSVTGIESHAFLSSEGLERVNLPDGIVYIGNEAFSGCTSLAEIRLPKKLESIGYRVFEGTAISSLTVPGGLIGCSNDGEQGPFFGMESLESIVVEEGVTTIDSYMFSALSSVKEITLPSTVTEIFNYAFMNSTALETVNLPEGLTEIGNQAFSGCDLLSGVILPKGLETVGKGAFYGTSIEELTIPAKLTASSSAAAQGPFSGIEKLTSVTLEKGRDSIPSYLLADLTSVKEIIIPEGVTKILNNAFYSCEALTSVKLPEGVTYIGEGAFMHCIKLSDIVLPDTVTEIAGGAFSDCESLTVMELPENINVMGKNVFSGTKIKSIFIPKTLNGIYYGSPFGGMDYLTDITIEDGLTEIPGGMFKDITNVEEIEIPESVTKIGASAFENCESLREIYIRDNVTLDGFQMFRNCKSLRKVRLPEKGMTRIDSVMFAGCEALEEIDIPDSVTTIGNRAFDSCTSLSGVVIHENITTIEELAFGWCSAFTVINIPDSVTNVDHDAFYDCFNSTIYCSEESAAAKCAIDNGIQINITREITEYDSFAHGTDYGFSDSTNNVGYIPFVLTYEVKDGVDRVPAFIDVVFSEEVGINENTVRFNGEPFLDYWEYGRTINMEIPDGARKGKLEFCIYPEDYSSIMSYAVIQFENDETETIGIINSSYPSLTLSADDRTGSGKITVVGYAPPEQDVEISVDDNTVKTVKSLKTGYYSADITLPDTENYKVYNVTAKSEKDWETISASKEVMFEDTAPQLESLVMNYGSDDERFDVVLRDGIRPVIVFNPANTYKFTAKLSNTEEIDKVYIVSTRRYEKKFIEAVYNPRTKSFVAEGWFDENNHSYVPGEITVEYTRKRKEVAVEDTFTEENLVKYMDPAVQDCETIINKNEDGEFDGTIKAPGELGDLIGDEINLVVNTVDQNYNDIPISDLLSAGEDFYSYFVDEDGEKYVLNIDYSDPENLVMIVHDIAENKQLKYLYKFIDTNIDETSDALRVSDVMGNIGQVTGVITDIYDIENDDESLRDQIMASGMTPEERREALKKAEELKSDRQAFLIATTALTIFAAGTVGPPAIVFGLLFNAVTTSSGFFWERRMANILGTGTGYSCNWQIDPSGYVYEGVPSNRLPGVTASAYWISPEFIDENGVGDESQAVFWDASQYRQTNPLVTDALGRYAWDVPEGLWQVVFEKDGYETFKTEWLPVPPPQTEVNVGLVSYAAPEFEKAEWNRGVLKVRFTKPVKTESINSIKILDGDGREMQYKVSYDTASVDDKGVNVCRDFEFTLSGAPVSVKATGGIESYAGVEMEAASVSVTVPEISCTFDPATGTAEIISNTDVSGVCVVAASYSGGRMVSVDSEYANLSDGSTEVVFDALITEGADTVKVLVLESLSSLNPLCGASETRIEM